MLVNNQGLPLGEELKSALDGARQFRAAAGYADPHACDELELARRSGEENLTVCLVLGRAHREGLAQTTLCYFQELDAELVENGGGVRVATSPFHSKIYCIDSPSQMQAWIGSSNFTRHGLYEWSEATLSPTDAGDQNEVCAEFDRLWEAATPLTEVEIPVRAIRTRGMRTAQAPREGGGPMPSLTLDFLDRSGHVPVKSGLNWWNAAGRPRDLDEAYIPLRIGDLEMAEAVFGSAQAGTEFEVIADDGKRLTLMLEGSQMGGAKQISSSGDKTVIGKYLLRDRLQHALGELVTREDLERYGRHTIDFFIDAEDTSEVLMIKMDFSPPPPGLQTPAFRDQLKLSI